MHLFEINILIFNFLLFSTCFEPGISSSRRRLYILLWHSVWCTHYMEYGIYILYYACIYNRLPEDRPSGSKRRRYQKIENENNNFEKVHFVGLYCIMWFEVSTELLLHVMISLVRRACTHTDGHRNTFLSNYSKP